MKLKHVIIGAVTAGVIGASTLISHAPCHYTGNTPQTVLQDSKCTPGVVNPILTQQKICSPGFTTGPYRNVPQSEKDQVMKEYGLTSLKGYEIDHLISLELGGSNDIHNLWAELGFPNPKDQIENLLHKRMCAGQITLQQAQDMIKSDWRLIK